MIIALCHVISVLRQYWARNWSNGYTVIGTMWLESAPVSMPFRYKDVIHMADNHLYDKTFPPPDGINPWYYPLVGMLYIHRGSRTAVFSNSYCNEQVCRLFEEWISHGEIYPTVILPEHLEVWVVASNGRIMTPRAAADVQNSIRRKMDPSDDSVDYEIYANIDQRLMKAYALKYLPK